MRCILKISEQSIGRNNYLFLFMQHNMCFVTSHSGEFLVTHGTSRILPIVGTFVKGQVELNIKGLGALVASMWLGGEKSRKATETQSFHNSRICPLPTRTAILVLSSLNGTIHPLGCSNQKPGNHVSIVLLYPPFSHSVGQ